MLILDDRSSSDLHARNGVRWRAVTDTVMGGVSAARLEPTVIGGKPCLRLAGEVSLENNGGFVQASLDLNEARLLDASDYEGIEIEVGLNDAGSFLQTGGHLQGLPVPLFEVEHGVQTFFQRRVRTCRIGRDTLMYRDIGVGLVETALLVSEQVAQADQMLGHLRGTGALIDQGLVDDVAQLRVAETSFHTGSFDCGWIWVHGTGAAKPRT